jgi:hypothetical protein
LIEYFFIEFRVSIGFSNERSGAVLVLLKGESPQAMRCWWCLLPACLGYVSAGFRYVSAGVAGGRVKVSRGLFEAKRCSAPAVPLISHP